LEFLDVLRGVAALLVGSAGTEAVPPAYLRWSVIVRPGEFGWSSSSS
jgi:hypothetical protein